MTCRREIENGKPAVAETGPCVAEPFDALIVRTTMPDDIHHSLKCSRITPFDQASYPAHILLPILEHLLKDILPLSGNGFR